MIRVSVLYPNEPGSTFDFDYYLNEHATLVGSLLGPHGLLRAEIDRGLGTAQPGADAPFVAVAHLYFDSVEAFQSAFAASAGDIMADLQNYTSIQPMIQISDIVLG